MQWRDQLLPPGLRAVKGGIERSATPSTRTRSVTASCTWRTVSDAYNFLFVFVCTKVNANQVQHAPCGRGGIQYSRPRVALSRGSSGVREDTACGLGVIWACCSAPSNETMYTDAMCPQRHTFLGLPCGRRKYILFCNSSSCCRYARSTSVTVVVL